MQVLQIILILSAGLPLGWAWWANRHTVLVHALFWAVLAWLAWLGSAVLLTSAARYLSVCLTVCAGVAVLGARRPGAAAWNAVVAGLLAVLLLPLAQTVLTDGELPVGPFRMGFLTVLLIVALANYLPTRLGLGAAALLAGCILELRYVEADVPPGVWRWPILLAALSTWLAATGLSVRKSKRVEPANLLWRDFRDRFGLVWSMRLRDQFNRSTANAGLAVEIGWRGLRSRGGEALSETERTGSLELLVALMARFGMP